MSYDDAETRLAEALAAMLAEEVREDVGLFWAADDATVIPANAMGIVLDQYPEDRDSVTLTLYPVSDDATLSDSVVGLQVTARAVDRGRVRAALGGVFAVLQGRERSTLGGVTVVQCFRQSGADLGGDGNERRARADNYYLTVHWPSEHRT